MKLPVTHGIAGLSLGPSSAAGAVVSSCAARSVVCHGTVVALALAWSIVYTDRVETAAVYRGGDLLESIHGSAPEWLVLLAALVTRLGDTWVVVGVAIAASWYLVIRERGPSGPSEADEELGRRPPGPWPVGVLVGGLAAMTALKYALALPRPTATAATPALLPAALEPTFVSTVTVGGYAFPSGHAMGAAVAYGLLAATLRIGSRRVRFAAAAGLVLAIALTRIVLAVHYPGDVVAGLVLGAAYLGGVLWVVERTTIDRTTAAFALALALAVVAVLVSAGGGRSVTFAALAAGGLVAWSIGYRVAAPRSMTGYGSESAGFGDGAMRFGDGAMRFGDGSAALGIGALVGLGVFAGGPSAVVPAAILGAVTVVPALLAAGRPG